MTAVVASGAQERDEAPTTMTASTIVTEARSLARLGRFYEVDLGLPVLGRDAATGRVVLDAAGARLVLVQRRGKEGSENPAVRLLLPVGDLEAARRKLQGLGVPCRDVLAADGSLQALYFLDPEGNRLGFVHRESPHERWLEPLVLGGGRESPRSSGRAELMVYSGMYGIWLGIAIPIGFELEDPESVGLTILATSPLMVLGAHSYAKRMGTTHGQARLIALGGNFGTWQAVGWAELADAKGEAAVLAAAAGGLAGMGVAGAIAPRLDVSHGQATLLHMATTWGAWYGLVGALVSENDTHDAVLASMLGGSTLSLALGSLWCTRNDISSSRVRLVSLGGLVGTVAGFGVDLITQPDNEAVVWGVPGVTGLAGLVAAAYWTRDRDAGEGAERSRIHDLSGGGAGARFDLTGPALRHPAPGDKLRLALFGARF